ncbi:MAG: hypothetical protein FWF34_01435 [Alphaproteobacteria bacterium]|nr:hypothetical protein [Alphaproteobacteria bacterium]MCL2889903.1 hypothetical protein [Alphaproteobacteria bacterium]
MTKTDAERRLADLMMDDVPVMEIPARMATVPSDWFERFKKVRREFMESLSDSIQELSFLNLSQETFMQLLMGRAIPENLSLRWRRPLEYGGELDIKNMFMCPRFPYGQNMDRFIAEQSGNNVLWIPNPAKKIYVPARLLGGGPGGNATSDRLAALAAQFAADRGMI